MEVCLEIWNLFLVEKKMSLVCFAHSRDILLNIQIYKLRCVLRTLWLVSYRLYIRLSKYGCDVTAYLPVLFYILVFASGYIKTSGHFLCLE